MHEPADLVLHKPLNRMRETHSRGFDLAPALLEKARARLTFVTSLFFVFCCLGIGIQATIGAEVTTILFAVYTINGIVSGALFLVLRSKALPQTTVPKLGLAYEVVLCCIVSVGFLYATVLERGLPSDVTWTCILIVMFPLVIPSPPVPTLIASLASAATVPLGLFVVASSNLVTPAPIDYVLISITPALCVVVALAGSRVVYELNLDVGRAQRMGSYLLVELLGKGGMGEVWKGQHRMLARPAAIKLIRPQMVRLATGAELSIALQRFEREAQATAMLTSPHTVELYDYGRADDGTFFYVMEFLDGFDLETMVERFGPVPPERVIHFLIQACDSLADAHHSCLIHRDIKPANLFVCRRGRQHDFVKILDFGLVKAQCRRFDDDGRLTLDGTTTGTPAFMPPELATQKSDADERCDLYALGCVAYWLLTGEFVYKGATPIEMIIGHVQSEPVPPSQRTEFPIPDGLERLVLRCLSKDPARRPQSAEVLAQRLAKIELDQPWTEERAERWWQRHRPEATPCPQPAAGSEQVVAG